VRPVDIKNVGKVIKNTKRRYEWHFKIHNDDHPEKCIDSTVILIDSTVSRKRTVMMSGVGIIMNNQVSLKFAE
jgi:hypothetical protein